MDKHRKLPKAIVGAFIFNDKGELFLMKTRQWKNRYNCPGGKVEIGESLVEAVKREVKEETNMDVHDVEFLSVIDGLGIGSEYTQEEEHFIFIDYTARVKNDKNIRLNQEGTSYKWLKPADWLKKDRSKFPHDYLLAEIKKLENGIPENYEHKYKRALADYQNLLKRTADEKQEFAKYANEQLLHDILPVYDNLKISLLHIDEQAQCNGWAAGIKYVVKQFKDALNGLGIEEIETVGKKFDPHTMEAVEGKGEKVKKELKAGYKLNGKVIIAAKVKLG